MADTNKSIYTKSESRSLRQKMSSLSLAVRLRSPHMNVHSRFLLRSYPGSSWSYLIASPRLCPASSNTAGFYYARYYCCLCNWFKFLKQLVKILENLQWSPGCCRYKCIIFQVIHPLFVGFLDLFFNEVKVLIWQLVVDDDIALQVVRTIDCSLFILSIVHTPFSDVIEIQYRKFGERNID